MLLVPALLIGKKRGPHSILTDLTVGSGGRILSSKAGKAPKAVEPFQGNLQFPERNAATGSPREEGYPPWSCIPSPKSFPPNNTFFPLHSTTSFSPQVVNSSSSSFFFLSYACFRSLPTTASHLLQFRLSSSSSCCRRLRPAFLVQHRPLHDELPRRQRCVARGHAGAHSAGASRG